MGEIRRYSTATPNPQPPVVPPTTAVKGGDVVQIDSKATYYNGKPMPDWVKNQTWIVSEARGDRAVIDKNTAGTNSINSPVNVKFLSVVNAPVFKPYLVRIANPLTIRKGAGASHASAGTAPVGVYTIVEEQNGWGRLKSGAGWIPLANLARV